MTGLLCIEALYESAPTQLAFRVPDLIPVVSEPTWDAKPEVKKAAYSTMENVCGMIVSKDIDRFIPELIKMYRQARERPRDCSLVGCHHIRHRRA